MRRTWPPDWWYHLRSSCWTLGSGLWGMPLNPGPRVLNDSISWCVIPVIGTTPSASRRLRGFTLRRFGLPPHQNLWCGGVRGRLAAAIAIASASTVLLLSIPAQAEQPKGMLQGAAEQTQQQEDNAIVVTKEITGKVSAINPMYHFLTVIYQQEKEKGVEYELLLNFKDNVELRFKRALSELQFGDTIRVSYDEKQEEAERQTTDGKTEHYTKVLSRQAKVITFLKPRAIGLVTNE